MEREWLWREDLIAFAKGRKASHGCDSMLRGEFSGEWRWWGGGRSTGSELKQSRKGDCSRGERNRRCRGRRSCEKNAIVADPDFLLDLHGLRNVLFHTQLVHVLCARIEIRPRVFSRAARHHHLNLPHGLRNIQAPGRYSFRPVFHAHVHGARTLDHRHHQHHVRPAEIAARFLCALGSQRRVPRLWRAAVRQVAHDVVPQSRARHVVGVLEHVAQYRRVSHPVSVGLLRAQLWMAVRHDRSRLNRDCDGFVSVQPSA
mmetsp:Transcript_15963/g.34527  ORF Transcript_15963/g.34527 Transcript_15963/m.34527 type:complete len:258 (+) Transcript_15963:133-906(+)